MFHWLAEHDEELQGLDCVSINLSGLTLDDEHMIDFIREQAEATGVRMETICFEVTETAGVSRLSNASNFINEIKKLGCRFSLDDFGSGLSSYAYLKNMPVDYLKIDGAFVKDILNSPSDNAVVKSICDIGHYLEKEVIAECVENEESRKLLRELGIDYLQGYGISKPVPLDEALRLMSAGS
jgi:EAL domain-containing protein (putative c-di-GMP-specific phosphodiesterase class I)